MTSPAPACSRGRAPDRSLSSSEEREREAHVASCVDCQREVSAVRALGDRLRALPTSAGSDAFAIRRLRVRVVGAFQASRALRAGSGSALPRTLPRALLLGGLVVCLGALFALVLVPGLVGRPALRASAGLPASLPSRARTLIEPEGSADLTDHHSATLHRVELREGCVRFEVDRGPNDAPLLVAVPDGEIEDIGTRFRVTVRGGHTREVAVDEGVVVLRLRGEAPRVLRASERWLSEEPIGVPSAAAGTAAVRVGPGAPSAQERSAPEPPRPPGPRSPGDEDEAYLSVMAALREGRRSDAQAAARGYLARFPNGFRRREIARVMARAE